MPWVKIDDNFYEHPKVTAVGLEATAVYVLSLSFSARYLTDGFIPTIQALRFGVAAHESAEALARRLVDAGLWEQVDGGYQVHDYLHYNPSGDTVKAERQERARRMAEWRNKRKCNTASNTTTDATTNTASTGCPVPVPVPVPQDHVCKNLDSNRDMGGVETPPPRPRQKRTPKPTTPPPEAVKIVQAETHRYPPKSWFGTIADTVGTEPDNLARWWRVVHAWIGSGYNPQNVQGMLDAYKRNEIPSTKGGGDAGNGKAPTSIPVREYYDN